MKAKLSFLALPLCFLGLVLVFALAACDSGGGSKHGEESSSSGGGYEPPPPVGNDSVELKNFAISKESDKIIIQGIFNAKGSEARLLRLELTTANGSNQPGWVSYNGQPVRGPITLSEKTINLGSKRTEIDLTNNDIPCGKHNITVKACVDAAGKSCTSDNGEFEKKASEYCVSSSAGGAVSSSSEATWTFDSPVTLEVRKDNEYTVGAVKFKLIEYENNGSIIAIDVTSGDVRDLTGVGSASLFDMDSDNDTGYPKPNKEYPNRKFNSMGSPMSNLDVVKEDYYFLYSSGGGEKYLIIFEPKSGSDWLAWPKQARYWKAKTSP